MKPAHPQLAAPQNEVRRHDQHAARLRDAGRDGSAHEALVQWKHKQPVKEDIDDRRDRGAHAHEHGRTVVAAVVVQERHQPRRHREKRIPEQIVTHELMIRLVCAEQRRDLGRQARTNEHHDERGRQRTGKRVHECLIGTGDVPAADAHGRDRHTAHDREHDDGVEHHHERPDQIDRAERVRANALADKNAVNDRKEKISAVAEDRRHNVLRELFRSAVHGSLRAQFAAKRTDFRPYGTRTVRPGRKYILIIVACQASVKRTVIFRMDRQKPLENLVIICYYCSMLKKGDYP